MNRVEIFEALRAGQIEEIKTQLVRYGEIVGDIQTDNDKGFFRIYTIRYRERKFVVDMHNGTTTSISVNGVRYTKK